MPPNAKAAFTMPVIKAPDIIKLTEKTKNIIKNSPKNRGLNIVEFILYDG